MTIGLVTDSNAQLPPALAERYAVEIVPLTVVVDGEEYAEGVDLDADAFYARFADGHTPEVSTSQPSPGRFAEAYERVAGAGATEILSIHIGASLSGTLNSARIAARGAPVPVRLVDTGTASFGIGCCVWEAGEALRSGATIEEAAAIAEQLAATVGNVFVVHALDLARAGGRLVVDEDDDGSVPVLTLVAGAIKPVGVAADMAAAAAVMSSYIVEAGSALRVAVGVADQAAAPLWQALEDRLRGRPEVWEIVRYRVGPSVAAYTGPGTAGAFFYSSPSGS